MLSTYNGYHIGGGLHADRSRNGRLWHADRLQVGQSLRIDGFRFAAGSGGLGFDVGIIVAAGGAAAAAARAARVVLERQHFVVVMLKV